MREVGIIVKPQGIRGEVKVKPLVSDLSVFEGFDSVFIDGIEYKLKDLRLHQGFIYLSLLSIQDRNKAEELRDKIISVDDSSLPGLKSGQYYVDELENCQINFETGEKVGKIVEVANYGASDILVIQNGTEEIMCPFLPHIFTEVDVNNKKIVACKKSFLEVTKSED